MDLKSYLHLYALLQTDMSSKEERRAYGISVMPDKNRPADQLLSWTEAHQERLRRPSIGDTLSSYLYVVTLILAVAGFIVGVFSGVVLLSYNGEEPVNVVYFMAMVTALPLFTMFLTVLSVFKVQSTQSVLVHISPSYWMERVMSLFHSKVSVDTDVLKVNPLLANWTVMKRAQLIALFFSLGLLFSLLVIVFTKDIAFAWSTTLQVTPEAFHSLINAIALPWREWLPAAVPSLSLIEQSHYFRLGERVSEEMIANAPELGEWWKFLLLSTLFYAIVLRLLVYILISFGYSFVLKKSFLTLDGAASLLRDMNEPIISTHASTVEKPFVTSHTDEVERLCHLDASYDVVQGWAIPPSQLQVMCDSMQIITPQVYEVGGGKSLQEDSEVVSKSHGEVLLYVKAWEPPTMDFMDYLEALLQKVDKVIVYPVGQASDGYATESKFIDIWANKLSLFKDEKVCFLDISVKEVHG